MIDPLILLGYVAPFLTLVTGAVLGYFFRKRADEHQIRYARRYERRAEVFTRLHELSLEVSQALFEWTSPFGYSEGPSKGELGQRAVDRFNELLKYHETHSSVWLEQGEREKAEEFVTEVRAIIDDFMDFVDMGGLREPGGPSWGELGEGKSRSKTWTEIHRRTRSELGRLREELGAEFHRGLS